MVAMILSGLVEPRPATVPLEIPQADSALSEAQEELVEFGLTRFADQGLVLPDLRVEFRSGPSDCGGHRGYYIVETQTVTMCNLDKQTMLHELAHVWAYSNLSAEEMDAFVRFRGLESWNDPTEPWESRGTEQAAEIIAWALMDRPITVRLTVETDDRVVRPVFRLFKITNSTAEDLYRGFVELTGMEPKFRSVADWDPELMEAEWQATMSAHTSPELARAAGSWQP